MRLIKNAYQVSLTAGHGAFWRTLWRGLKARLAAQLDELQALIQLLRSKL